MKKWIVLSYLCCAVLGGFAQDANVLLQELVAKMNSVKDYSAAAVITSDIPMVKILPSQATIYFKQKDKLKIDSKGIVILPKQGFTDVAKMLEDKNSYTAMVIGSEVINGTKTDIVSVFPVSDTSDLILAKMWIDPTNDILLKSQITTRSAGVVMIQYTYGAQKKWGLPDQLIFTVDVKKFKLPKGVATDINRTTNDADKPQAKTGTIKIDLSNYKVNQGLSDDLFKK
jgi:hypothetical protein